MKELHEWFQRNRRDFPWREDPTPYKVWISEVMLQQTRASVVIPYFEKWVREFPNAKTLAEAPLEKVIKIWEGLGYYSRARNLHKGAQQIVDQFGGEIPGNRADLESIDGLGPYTIGAILSFGFKQKAAAVDGNVTRVISRYFLIEENVCKATVKRKIVARAEELLDSTEPWVTAEALIELGATLCSRSPRCAICPLSPTCQGKEKAEILPIKNGDQKTIHLKRIVAWIEAEGKILVRKGEAGKVMADLYEFPYFEWPQKKIGETIYKTFGVKVKLIEKLQGTVHTFTRYKAHLYPVRFRACSCPPVPGHQWIPKETLSELPFSSGHRRILIQ